MNARSGRSSFGVRNAHVLSGGVTRRGQTKQCSAVATERRPPLQRETLINTNERVKQDKLEEEYQEMDVLQGLVTINPRYSPKLIQERALESPAATLKTMARVVEIVGSVGLFFAKLKVDDITGRSDDTEQVRTRAAEARDLLTNLGPCFIKAGQVLANRPDIIRQDYMDELCVLQDDVPSFPDDKAFQIIEENLGRPMEEVLSAISERPIAAASLGQVYKAVLRETGEDVAVKVQRPGVEPRIMRDLFIFRAIAALINPVARARLGCNAALIVDEFGEKLMEELDYSLEARNIRDFYENFKGDTAVKIPWVRQDLSGQTCLLMEWIDGVRCTDPAAIHAAPTIEVQQFIQLGVVSGMRQLLEFGLFHGDPHPGNIFAMEDGRIAYVDFGNVAQLSQYNKQVLIDAVVHAVNKDYEGMAGDFVNLGFLSKGTDVTPIVPALEKIWAAALGQSLADFNFRTVTSKFNELVYNFPIRIPERYSLVIRSLLTQEGICLTLDPSFHFLEVAYPYIAKRLLTDESLRERLIQVLFQNGKFQWERLENLIKLAKDGAGGSALDLSETAKDAVRVLLTDTSLRAQLVAALTEDNKLHVEEVSRLLALVGDDVDLRVIVQSIASDIPSLSRQVALSWSDRILAN